MEQSGGNQNPEILQSMLMNGKQTLDILFIMAASHSGKTVSSEWRDIFHMSHCPWSHCHSTEKWILKER